MRGRCEEGGWGGEGGRLRWASPWMSSYGMRVGKASCMTRTASMTPEHRSWSRTIDCVKTRGFFSALGLMQRTNDDLAACSSPRRELRSLTKRFETDENAAFLVAFCADSYSSVNISLSIGSDEFTMTSSQPGSRVSLFFSSHETSAALVSFSIVCGGGGARQARVRLAEEGTRTANPWAHGRWSHLGGVVDDVAGVVADDEALLVAHPLRARRGKELILAVQLVDLRAVGLVRSLGRLALRVEETEDAVGRLLHQLDRGLVVLELDLLPRHALLDVELLLSLEDAGQEELAAEKEEGVRVSSGTSLGRLAGWARWGDSAWAVLLAGPGWAAPALSDATVRGRLVQLGVAGVLGARVAGWGRAPAAASRCRS